MKITRESIMLLVLSAPMSWAASPFALDGIVREEKTGRPLEGVFIVVQWLNTGGGFIDSRTTCSHLEVTRTDAQGRYHIPARLSAMHPFVDRYVIPFKIGYEKVIAKKTMTMGEYEDSLKNMVMRPYTGPGGVRIDQYRFTAFLRTCGHDRIEAYRKLLPLERSINEEARTLKVEPEREAELDGTIGYLKEFERQLNALESGTWR